MVQNSDYLVVNKEVLSAGNNTKGEVAILDRESKSPSPDLEQRLAVGIMSEKKCLDSEAQVKNPSQNKNESFCDKCHGCSSAVTGVIERSFHK